MRAKKRGGLEWRYVINPRCSGRQKVAQKLRGSPWKADVHYGAGTTTGRIVQYNAIGSGSTLRGRREKNCLELIRRCIVSGASTAPYSPSRPLMPRTLQPLHGILDANLDGFTGPPPSMKKVWSASKADGMAFHQGQCLSSPHLAKNFDKSHTISLSDVLPRWR